MLKMGGHTVFLYGGTQNEAQCDEFVPCFTEEQRLAILDHQHYTRANWNPPFPPWVDYRVAVSREINTRKQPGDIICHLGGVCLSELADMVPGHKVVEYGIGYSGYGSPWLVFESHMWMAYCLGAERNLDTPVNQHTHVIHSFYDRGEFPIVLTPGTYACFVGRLTKTKGVSEACEAAAKAGLPMFVAGVGDKRLVTHGATYLGPVGLAERNGLMANARALLCPTLTFEPFGNVACEAQMCGTPVVCTDWGGFVETVDHGKTGFRCRTVDQMAKALGLVGKLNREAVVQQATAQWGLEAKRHEYELYFRHLASIKD